MDSQTQTSAVLSAVRHILRPLAKLMLAQGITFATIAELLKQVLVETAQKDFPVPGKVTNDSRISVLTGVHRKDVKRLRQQRGPEANVPKTVSLGSQVVNVWLTESRWLEADGSPRVLHKSAGSTAEPGFEELAECVSKDVRPRAILDELVRVGAVTLWQDKRVQLNAAAFIPHEGVEEKLYYLERTAYAHLMASVHNVQGGKPPFFDRIVHYDKLPPEALPGLRELVDIESMRMLRAVNDLARKSATKKTDDPQSFTLGAFMFTEAAGSASATEEDKD